MYAIINDSSKRCVVITVMTTRTEPVFHGRCHRSVVVMLWPLFAPVTCTCMNIHTCDVKDYCVAYEWMLLHPVFIHGRFYSARITPSIHSWVTARNLTNVVHVVGFVRNPCLKYATFVRCTSREYQPVVTHGSVVIVCLAWVLALPMYCCLFLSTLSCSAKANTYSTMDACFQVHSHVCSPLCVNALLVEDRSNKTPFDFQC